METGSSFQLGIYSKRLFGFQFTCDYSTSQSQDHSELDHSDINDLSTLRQVAQTQLVVVGYWRAGSREVPPGH